jgi:hypothetical protein
MLDGDLVIRKSAESKLSREAIKVAISLLNEGVFTSSCNDIIGICGPSTRFGGGIRDFITGHSTSERIQ